MSLGFRTFLMVLGAAILVSGLTSTVKLETRDNPLGENVRRVDEDASRRRVLVQLVTEQDRADAAAEAADEAAEEAAERAEELAEEREEAAEELAEEREEAAEELAEEREEAAEQRADEQESEERESGDEDGPGD